VVLVVVYLCVGMG